MNFVLKLLSSASTSSHSTNIITTESALTKSPFNNVPYDVLQEIFLHCLPENPLDEVQPNPQIAPLLLCHVSSSWRTVALSTPSLWMYLHIRLPILWDRNRNPITSSPGAINRAIESTKWWKRNHGSMNPLLRFNYYRLEDIESEENSEDGVPDELSPIAYPPVSPQALLFLLEYVSSAQYLEVGQFYNYLIRNRGLSMETSSKLYTLVEFDDQMDDEYDREYPYHATLPPSQIPSTVRRLFIQDVRVLSNSRLINWSRLTHLSLNHVYLIQISTWFTLIRELTNLQWGDFVICVKPTDAMVVQPEPPIFTLSSLVNLTILCHSIQGIEFPTSTLFRNLQLPALRTLYLSSEVSWRESHATFEIGSVLKSAPAITKFALRSSGYGFCAFGDPGAGMLTPIEANRMVLSRNPPHVSHLQLMLRSSTSIFVADLVREFVMAWVATNGSLDLESPTITKTIPRTIIITVLSENHWTNRPNWKPLLLQEIDERVGAEPGIMFEINASESGRGFHDPESTLKRWRSNSAA